MPKRCAAQKIMSRASNKCSFRCKFCRKLLKYEDELHIYVCEKVPQEIFNQPNTPFGGSSVSFGTTSNSSLTNPLLGAPEDK